MTAASSGSHRRVVDRALYALFSRHADRSRHDRDRRRYRGTDIKGSFEVYVARVYGLATAVGAGAFAVALVVGLGVPDRTVVTALSVAGKAVPSLPFRPPAVPRVPVATAVACVTAASVRWATVAAGGQYLALRTRARRAGIRRTLPGAVRYLRTLTSGCDEPRAMLRKVAANEEAYGETAVACRKVLNRAALTGNLGEALRGVARDTPSSEALSPFLLKFREHAGQGPDELAAYLRLEGRMLSHHQARARERAGAFLELVAELFVVLLVLPALLVIVLTVMGVLAPGLGAPVRTPLGTTTVRATMFLGSVGFVLAVGALSALLVHSLRPVSLSTAQYRRPDGVWAVLATVPVNPASARAALAPVGIAGAGLLAYGGVRPTVAVLLGYAAFGLPVGLVGIRRARRDDAKDRQIKDFVHAVAGHVGLGHPFPDAVELVAREVDLGPLDDHVAELAFNANLAAAPTGEGTHRRTAALGRFVDGVGTPLAEQTMGLVTGALDAGSDTDDVFETLQTEIGRLYHEKRALRSNMLVYVAVGWTTALLVVAIMVTVDAYVLEGFAQLNAVSGTGTGLAVDPGAVRPARDRYRFYLITQATVLACGWFAGTASRGGYEALLHSSALVLVAHVVFAGAGLV